MTAFGDRMRSVLHGHGISADTVAESYDAAAFGNATVTFDVGRGVFLRAMTDRGDEILQLSLGPTANSRFFLFEYVEMALGHRQEFDAPVESLQIEQRVQRLCAELPQIQSRLQREGRAAISQALQALEDAQHRRDIARYGGRTSDLIRTDSTGKEGK